MRGSGDMYCEHCGKAVDPGARFCGACSAPIHAAAARGPAEPGAQPSSGGVTPAPAVLQAAEVTHTVQAPSAGSEPPAAHPADKPESQYVSSGFDDSTSEKWAFFGAIAVTVCWVHFHHGLPSWHWLLSGTISQIMVAFAGLILLPLSAIRLAYSQITGNTEYMGDGAAREAMREIVHWISAVIAAVVGVLAVFVFALWVLGHPVFNVLFMHTFLIWPTAFITVYVSVRLGVFIGALPFAILRALVRGR